MQEYRSAHVDGKRDVLPNWLSFVAAPGPAQGVTIPDLTIARGQAEGGGTLSTFKRFHLRSILIGISALAILMGAIRFVSDLLGIRGITIQIQGSNVFIGLETAFAESTGPVSFVHDISVQIPIAIIVVLIAAPVLLLAAIVFWRSRGARNRARRDSGKSKEGGSAAPD
jgi:hypothetical protein